MNLLYIHTLPHLSPRMAELESVYLVRELKQKVPYPLTPARLQEQFAEFVISPTDQELLVRALEAIAPVREAVQQILSEKNQLHEAVNVQRTLQILDELPGPLHNNLLYLQDLSAWQDSSISEVVPVLNSIPKLRSAEEKKACDQKLSVVFERILRNKQFAFRHDDLINEAFLAHITGLQEGLAKGYLFHYTLEEELKKASFEAIKARIPQYELERAETIRGSVTVIKRGVERAYQANFRMVQWATILYAYVKWAMG